MKNILLIGGAGYVGTEIIKYFLKKNIKVTCLDNLIYGQKFNLKNKLLNFLNLDITQKKEIRKINKFYDTVLILAGLVGDPIAKKYKSLCPCTVAVHIATPPDIQCGLLGIKCKSDLFSPQCFV